MGELLATSAMKAGIRGAIVDGMVRDIDALEAMRFPVWARGLSVSGCNKDGGGEVGAVIACGGVAVRPGDVIVADRDGAAVVPLEDAAAVAGLADGDRSQGAQAAGRDRAWGAGAPRDRRDAAARGGDRVTG